MKRSDLKVGERYAGPGGRCYQIEDLSPGWRVDGRGEWVEDTSSRTRHLPGRGEVAYRANLSLKAYLVDDDGNFKKAVVDPRRITEPWVEHEVKETLRQRDLVNSHRLLTLLRRNLRDYPGYRPAPSRNYSVSSDGEQVTIPLRDLSALMDVAFGQPS